MTDHSTALYLNLLKKSLTDYLNVRSAYANGVPPEFWWKKRPLKNLRNRLLVRWLKRSKMVVLRVDNISPDEREKLRRSGEDWPLQNAQTMVGLDRLDNIQNLAETILVEGIDGDFIETGIWRGGSCIFMRGILDAYNDQTRKVWACDSFEGLPDPDIDKYPEDEGTPFHLWNFFLAVSQEEVEANFEKYGLLDDRVVFVKGYFEETLPNIECQKISLMRLDGDQYGSTIVALESLYPKLSNGGFVIIDDYISVDACRTAVHDYRKANGIRDEIIQIDWASVYWQKSK